MNSEEKITHLSEFVICQSDDCHEAISIYHKNYFKDNHYDMVNNKKVAHKSTPFDQSVQFLNFKSITRLHFIISKKMKTILKGLPTDIDTVVQTALYKSELFQQVFLHSDQAISQFFYLSQIDRNIPMNKAYCLSADFCNAISIPNEKIVSKAYKELCAYSPEWQFLNSEFNYASGINSTHLESFVQQQVAYFAYYCSKIEQEKKQFNIREYVNIRNSSKQYVNDAYYYSHQFVTFLIQKYEMNPGAEEIFNLMEYYLHFWQYFFVLLDNSKNVVKYFDQEVGFYREYETFMLSQKLEESFLSYRIWRLNQKTSSYLPSLKNPFFLQTFIYSFIEEIIEKKLFFPEQKVSYDFKAFATYLHDYALFVGQKKEEFNFARYREYLEFRKLAEKLEENLRKNKEIVYDKKFFLEYAHNQFVEGSKLAVKKYKKYQEKRRQEEDQKDRVFRAESRNLKQELKAEEKGLFYQILYNNFLNQVQQKNSGFSLTKESYKLYRQKFLESVDESYIQEKEAEYQHSIAEMHEQMMTGQNEKEKGKEAQKVIVKEEINPDQEEMADLIQDEQNSEASSEEQEREFEENCPCCKGHPYQCQQPECKILGCCSACMLGD